MLAGIWYIVPPPAIAVITVGTHRSSPRPPAQEPSLSLLRVERWMESEPNRRLEQETLLEKPAVGKGLPWASVQHPTPSPPWLPSLGGQLGSPYVLDIKQVSEWHAHLCLQQGRHCAGEGETHCTRSVSFHVTWLRVMQTK